MAVIKYNWFFLLLILLSGCTTVQHISKADVNYTVIKSDSPIPDDEIINTIVAPYKAQLDAVMNEILTVLPAELTKQKPESVLGNLVSDVIVDRLRSDGFEVDLAVVNYGGLRVPYLSEGPLTRGEIFELTPFDNTLMILDIPGTKLDSFFLLIAETDGWPISKEARLVIGNKKLISAMVGGLPVDPARIYKVATLDYVATGGDNMKVLIPLPRKETGLIFRDVLIDYFKGTATTNKPVTGTIEGRIIKQ